jgi:hypothetical protein
MAQVLLKVVDGMTVDLAVNVMQVCTAGPRFIYEVFGTSDMVLTLCGVAVLLQICSGSTLAWTSSCH